jgi:hypothetical protein
MKEYIDECESALIQWILNNQLDEVFWFTKCEIFRVNYKLWITKIEEEWKFLNENEISNYYLSQQEKREQVLRVSEKYFPNF